VNLIVPCGGFYLFSRLGLVGWSAIRKCALSSALFMRVEVPLALK
jgi:hypothetical protein